MTPSTFQEVYRSLKQKEAADNLNLLALFNQAGNGTKQSIKAFTEDLSVWLPEAKSNEGSRLSGYKALLQGKKIGKSGRK